MRDDPRCLPSSGSPSQDPVAESSFEVLSPVPRPARVLSDPADRRVTLSRHPGTSPIPRPGSTARSGSRSSFHSRAMSRARSLFTRGVPLFGGRSASVFETRRRLTTSATATTYGHLAWALRVLAFVEGGLNLRPGSDASSCYARHAASRAASGRPSPVIGSSGFPRFARRRTWPAPWSHPGTPRGVLELFSLPPLRG